MLLFSAPVAAQTELDARAQAAAYGKDYMPVPENQTVLTPSLLEGIWQGADRFVFFVAPSDQAVSAAEAENTRTGIINPVNAPESVVKTAAAASLPSDMVVILKTYYGWFYDRAAEPASYADNTSRFLCSATAKEAEHITVTYEPLLTRASRYGAAGDLISDDSGVWEIVIQYGTKQRNITRIPVAVIGNNLYLDFLIKARTDSTTVSEAGNPLSGYWQGVSRQNGIRMSPFPVNENITSYYVVDNAVYKLRYWITTMEYTDEIASYKDVNQMFNAPKYIVSDGNVFTCVTGRSKQIRNVDKSPVPFTDYTLDSNRNICVFGKPYLTKVVGKNNVPALMQIVAEANRRRKPDPPPLFPPDNLNWHWDLISLLEKDNAQVQAVRKRQKDFSQTNGREGRIDAVQAASYSTYTRLEGEVTRGLQNTSVTSK